jgi:hypothetical protein
MKKAGTKKQTEQVDASFLEIDKNILDEEWVNQPDLFFRYATKKAQAERKMDEAKNEMKVVEAELQAAVRANPKKYDLEKITDKSVESTVLLEDDYQEAVEVYNNAKYEYGILDAACRALDQRKKALESLVHLHGQDYFSTPQAGEHGKEFARDAERKVSRSRHKLKRRDQDDEDDDE